MSTPEEKLAELGITFSDARTPIANYVGVRQAGNTLYFSGAGPITSDGKPLYTGKLGGEISLEQGYECARLAGITLIANLKMAVGDLSRVSHFVKIMGFVASTSDFYQQPAVINGTSDILVEVFGDIGRHARSAVGVASLPMNLPVEVEMVVQLKD